MQSNFNINLPSIPGRELKFKIQDVRLKGFLTRQARFKDDKEYLTKRFINSFANLQPKHSPPPVETNSEASTSLSSCFREEQDNFRWMVGDDKKNLLIKYQDHYKSYQPPLPSIDKAKGFTFPKQGAKDTLDEQLRQYQSQLMPNDKPIENYYFNMTEQSDDESDDLEELEKKRDEKLKKKKHLHPSAAFKSQDRWQNKERQLKSKIKPGPGSYVLETMKHSPSPKKKLENPEHFMPIKEKLKDFLKDFKEYKSIQLGEEKKPEVVKHCSSIFAEANVDRFGNQKFPTLVKLSVPGPGSYETHGNMEEKAKKILIVQEQRKLLREWYND